jgi:predicted PurR-regulated permease PerM
MSKETLNDIANKATATSSTAMLAAMVWVGTQIADIKTQLATHIQQTQTLIQKLETRIENLERRVGAIGQGRHD